jgi:hypothetical protein
MKICVYTICKNELQFIERYLEHLKDADLIHISDTGSTVRVNIGKLGYEARFSYTMEHPFYLELNGIIV